MACYCCYFWYFAGKETAFFRFRVTDHVNTSQVTMFEMESILLILTLESCQTLNLFPGQTQPITSFHLKSKTNYTNFPDHSLLYKIIKRPSKGYLVLSSNGQHNEIDEFTQEDLNAKMVLYNHSSQMDGWTQYDFFVFQVHSNFTLNLLLETFNVSISYSNIDLNDSIWNFTCQHAVVSEGGKVVITRSELDASVMEYQLSSYGLEEVVVRLIVQEIPRHGFMTLGVVNMTRGSKIVQQDIDQGLLIYSHDDSESYSDEFSFTVEIVAKVKTRSSKPELHQLPHLLRVFPFTVEPINDQHFSLLTPVPAIELVQGSNYLITDEVLLTIDPDTPSENITYEIASPPTNGFLICLNEAGPEQVMSFTQKDINEKRIQFVHDGSSDSGAFYFRVSDGIHRPLYKVFNILIMPLVVDIMLTPIEILQGQNQTILSQHQFKVKTNGRKEVLMYNITRPPKYGSLFKNNTVTCHFSQMEVEAGQIYYLQDDLSTFADEFEFLLYDIKNTIHGKTDINVLPNIKNIDGRPLSAVINNASEISLSHLDAGELAKMTSSDPVYHVTHCPAHGVLVRLSILNVQMEDWSNKGKGQTSTGRKLKLGQNYVDSFFQFTHSDIANRRIKYLPNHNITSMELTDSFGYIVIARSVQPARGIFHIKVFQTEVHTQRDLRELVDEQEISADNVSTIFPKTYLVPLSAMEVEEVKSFDKSFIIVLALLAILIIIVIAIIAIRCVKRNRQANAQIKEASIVSLVPSAAFPLAVPSSTKDNQESQHNLPIIQEEPVLETCTVTLQGQGPDVVDLTLVTHPQESQSLSAVHSPTNISSKGLDEKLLLYFERLTAV